MNYDYVNKNQFIEVTLTGGGRCLFNKSDVKLIFEEKNTYDDNIRCVISFKDKSIITVKEPFEEIAEKIKQ